MPNHPEPNPSTLYVVYGRKSVVISGRTHTMAVTKDRLTRDGAKAWLTHQIMNGGHIDAVIVMLLHGVDTHGERFVVHRVGNGRAWWE